MLLCDLPRAIDYPLATRPSPRRPSSRPVAYILYQTHPSVHPLKHIAARKIRIDHEVVVTRGARVLHGAYIYECIEIHARAETRRNRVDDTTTGIPPRCTYLPTRPGKQKCVLRSGYLRSESTRVFCCRYIRLYPVRLSVFSCARARVHLVHERSTQREIVCYDGISRGHCDRRMSWVCASVWV